MKKIYLIIIVAFVLLFSTCTKDKEPSQLGVVINNVEPANYSVLIEGKYIFDNEISDLYLLYGNNPILSDIAIRKRIDIQEKMFSVTITDLLPDVKYYFYIEYSSKYSNFKTDIYSFMTLNDKNPDIPDNPSIPEEPDDLNEGSDGKINGYDYVDLGLPSGLKWALYNIGSLSPEDYGNYYAWGETITKDKYELENSSTYGISIDDISGNVQYDAATANWGVPWRMPTNNEINELITSCMWTWTTCNGVNGYNVTSKTNHKSIFIPAAGFREGFDLLYVLSCGYFWGSTPCENDNESYSVICRNMLYEAAYMTSFLRYCGLSVRPVTD